MRAAERLDFRLLGPLEVSAGGAPLPLGGSKQRAVLAVLLVHANEPVSTDRLVDALWGYRPPGTAKTALQGYITHLRRLLEPNRKKRTAGEVLVTTAAGYVLHVAADAFDRDRFEALASQGQRALSSGRAGQAADLLRGALDLWRGPALADFVYEQWAHAEVERLAELRMVCFEERIEAELQLGRHAELVGELEALVAEHPLRERLREQLMLALYRSGRQAEALDVYQQTRRLLVDELGVDPSPELRELEAAILRQDVALAVAAAARPPPTNLPAPPTPLVGRARELEQAGALLAREDVRLLTLTGAGGSGKTRLALELADRALSRFRDGVFLCELAQITEPDGVLAAIARVLDLRGGGRKPLLDQLEAALAERGVLLVLDNLEQVLDVGPALSELLSFCPRVVLLATGRAPLHLSAEHEYPLGPLAEEDAAELFRLRAKAVRPDFSADREVDEICRHLDRLPLAIELAAARVKILPAAALLERLEHHQGMELLTGGARDLPERQQTLRATLEWSHALLDPAEQRLFTRLGVFAGGFRLEAAEEICAADLEAVAALLDKSLLVERHEGDTSRFSMLETVRDFALEQLEAQGEADELRERHAAFFLALAEEAAPEVRAGRDPRWLGLLEREHDNLRAALGFALERGEMELALRLAASLVRFWNSRYPVEGRRWLDRVLPRSSGQPPTLRATALEGAGAIAETLGDWEAARAFGEESLAIFRELGDVHGVAQALDGLGTVAQVGFGDHKPALLLFEEAMANYREAGDSRSEAIIAMDIGYGLLQQGEYDRAEARFEQSLDALREFEDWNAVAVCLHNLSLTALYQDRSEAARERIEEALRLSTEFGFSRIVAYCLDVLAAIAASRGDVGRAARLLGAADALLERFGAALEPFEGKVHERTVSTVRAQLDEDTFARCAAKGRALTVEQATAEALLVCQADDGV
jgi:predicted ATPase/DNA-binding SARP family transcriptional activator